ncbi:MAG: radical SAM protein, partial [Erysipelotrichaceae bacterium]|nr:radical SAM protein [Erysipelotrichaceae bacterium]
RQLYDKPYLRHLFLELTLKCNEHCFHCGSNCTSIAGEELTLEEYKDIIDQIKEDFGTKGIYLCITGGEPLLRPDWFDIMMYAHEQGFHWGMTSNATLITKEVAHQLAVSGMKTISVSIDGLPDTHDRLRGYKGGYEQAMRGIQNLIDENAFDHIQVTTVFNHENLKERDELFEIMKGIDIDSWRVTNLEPIGRALLSPNLMCTKEDYVTMFDFIRDKRRQGYPVIYGCTHYLGDEYEGTVRDWIWTCSAGILTGSIMANGDIGACLDIERRPETIQGNIRHDRFKDVWENRFELFRQPLDQLSPICKGCAHAYECRGDSYHSYNYDKMAPMVCMKGTLFD